MMVWINGELVFAADARVSVFDHGLTTGDGVFEALKVIEGTPFALQRHLARLASSAAGLGLPAPDLDAIQAGVFAVLGASGRPDRARIRITVTAGESPLGSERGESPPTVVIALGPLPERAPESDATLVPWPRNERGALAGVKTISYAENVRALAYAAQRGAGEAIFANTQENLCEGTGSNVFLVVGDELITPPLSAGCLAGVTRGLVLEWFGGTERDVPAAVLTRGDDPPETLVWVREAFLTSTTRDVQPIRSVNGVALPACPGPVTRKAAQVFASRAARSPDP
ncbi:MAG TPA: aminotransferase class IV [Streptosporangiaceae bacterium]|nr:aminotransferase class IV [Streptosporangiaceae bacterium]